jgi:hypothetical protein
VLSALTVALLSSVPHRAEEWLDLLVCHLNRDESRRVWRIMTHYFGWLELCDTHRASRFLDDLFNKSPSLLECAQGLVLLARSSWWMDQELVEKWACVIRTSTWPHALAAYGELLGLCASRSPAAPWADDELLQLVSAPVGDPNQDGILVGAARSLAHMWREPGPRARCTDYLVTLLDRKTGSIDEGIISVLALQHSIVDEYAVRLLEALAKRPECFLLTNGVRAIKWLATLVFARTDLVAYVVGTVTSLLAAGKGDRSAFIGVSNELIDLTLTLQRIPQFRERGLTAFEQLLDAGIYGARQALDRVDDLTTLARRSTTARTG